MHWGIGELSGHTVQQTLNLLITFLALNSNSYQKITSPISNADGKVEITYFMHLSLTYINILYATFFNMYLYTSFRLF